MTLTIVTTIGSYMGIGAKDSTFARPGNQKYVETAYFVGLLVMLLSSESLTIL